MSKLTVDMLSWTKSKYMKVNQDENNKFIHPHFHFESLCLKQC